MGVDVTKAYKGLGFAFETFIENELDGDIYTNDPLAPMKTGGKGESRAEYPAIKVNKDEKIIFINWMEMYKRLPDVKIETNRGAKGHLETAFGRTDVKEIIKWFETIVENKTWFEDSGFISEKREKKKWEVRFYNYPETRRITEITSEDRNLLVTMRGIPIVRGREVYAHPFSAIWYCADCGDPAYQYFRRGEKIKKFKRVCSTMIGEGEKAFRCRGVNWLGGETEVYRNFFNIQIEATIDETPNKIEPPVFSMEFADNICAEQYLNELHLGSAYRFTGIIQMKSRTDKQGVRMDFPYMEVMAFEEIEKRKFSFIISEDEKSQIQNFMKKEDSLDVATNMFGKRVIGFYREKKLFILAKLMQERFNKVKKNPKNYIMHLLIVGNYARGKSELAEAFQEICENPFYIIGSATTGVGLTGITIRDEMTGMYGIQAGVLARASSDSLFVEEYDKTRDKTELGVLNEAMSKFQYTVTKGGKHRTFKSNTQVVMIANPEKKVFDETLSLIPQVNISGDLLSRFSAISCILSAKDIESEIQINKIMIQRSTKEIYQKDQETAEFLKKCLKIASEQEPKMDIPEIEEFVNNFTRQAHVLAKQTQGADKDFYSNITPRHRMTLIKLIKAVAMWHLHPVPTREDMDEAFSLISKFWKEFIEKPRLLNMQEIEQGMSMAEIEDKVSQQMADERWDVIEEETISSKKDKVETLIEFIEHQILDKEEKMIDIEEVKKFAMEKLEYTSRGFDELLEKLIRGGELFEPRKGFVKPI